MTISLGLITIISLGLMKLLQSSKESQQKIESSSISEKAIITEILDLRNADFDSIRRIIYEASSNNFKCDNLNRPQNPVQAELILYNWRKISNKHELCIDIHSHEFEFGNNIIDIRFRGLVRSIVSKNIYPNETKFITMRRAR